MEGWKQVLFRKYGAEAAEYKQFFLKTYLPYGQKSFEFGNTVLYGLQ